MTGWNACTTVPTGRQGCVGLQLAGEHELPLYDKYPEHRLPWRSPYPIAGSDPGDQHEPRPDIELLHDASRYEHLLQPYKHEAGSGGENTYLSDKTIGSVRVLWQSKDAGTSGDLVMGYAVSNEAG